jgi:heme-degrading monooxygenase HmoA
MIHQLRIYQIFEDNKQAFHDRFRDHAMRIMESYGFHIVSIWESQADGRTELVYLLQWPDEVTMKESWAGFMADVEWKDIKKEWAAEHGQAVGEIKEKVLIPTDYTPRS